MADDKDDLDKRIRDFAEHLELAKPSGIAPSTIFLDSDFKIEGGISFFEELDAANATERLVPLTPSQIETIKISANYANGVAIALFAVGALAPVVKVFGSDAGQSTGITASVAVICILLSGGLHWVARHILKGLR